MKDNEYHPTHSNDFYLYVVKALLFHLLLLGLLVYLPKLIPHFFTHKNDMIVILPSIRVDVVELPKFTLNQLKALQDLDSERKVNKKEIKEIQEEVKDDDAFKKVSNSFMDKLKKLGATKIEKVAIKKENKNHLGLNAKELNKLIHAGNKISKGAGLTGDYKQEVENSFVFYGEKIVDSVRPFWKLPSYLMDQNLAGKIKITISSSGKLLKMSIYESSGNSSYDKKAMDAIENASPFHGPPKEIWELLANEGVILAFPL